MTARKGWLLAAAAALLLLLPPRAFSANFGYYSWGRGWPSVGVPDFLKEYAPGLEDLKVDLCYDHFSLGYLYDGASPSGRRFGWRYNLGLDIAVSTLQGSSTSSTYGSILQDLSSQFFDAMGFGFSTKLAYGMGIYQNGTVRVWAGPSVRLAADYIAQPTTTVHYGSIRYDATPWGISLSFGGGAEAGVTWAVSPSVTLDLGAGFHYNFFGYYQDARLRADLKPVDGDASFLMGQEPYVFVQAALRFDLPTP